MSNLTSNINERISLFRLFPDVVNSVQVNLRVIAERITNKVILKKKKKKEKDVRCVGSRESLQMEI